MPVKSNRESKMIERTSVKKVRNSGDI